MFTRILGFVSLLTVAVTISAEPTHTIRVAVAANFKPTLQQLVAAFENSSDSNLSVKLSSGSTGALFAQITKGAPFHLFLAADVARPQRLESEDRTRTGSRVTYAKGRLVFWQPSGEPVTETSLRDYDAPLAIANPVVAPYGSASLELLAHLGVSPPLIQGGNIAQAYTFVETGNAKAGLVALSQVIQRNIPANEYWIVPENYHHAIEQQMVVLKNAPDEADSFAAFLESGLAKNMIRSAGYSIEAGE